MPFDRSVNANKCYWQLLMKAPILAYLDFTHGYLLETNASGAGLGAVLVQDKTIIRFDL